MSDTEVVVVTEKQPSIEIIQDTLSDTITIQEAQKDAIIIQEGTVGPRGAGVLPGGNYNQILRKASNNDYDTEWVDYLIKTLSVEDPATGDKYPFFYTSNDIKIRSIIPGVIGSNASVTFSIRYGSNMNQSGNEITVGGININTSNNGTVFTSFDTDTIPNNNYLWITIPYANTTTQWFNLTFNY